jgi:Copper amine oxidase N-terminal domain.
MKRKLMFPLVLVLVLLMAAPASAAQLNVNGKNYAASSLNLQDEVSSVPVTVLSHILGCTVTVDGTNITIQENQDCLKMIINSKTAWFNDKEVESPWAPQYINSQVYVPLAFVCRSFGAEVAWDDAQQLLTVTYNETRGDMTAMDLLAKSQQKLMDANRYKMTTDMDMDMNMTAQSTGQSPQAFNIKAKNTGDCWVQTNPMVFYIKQNTNVSMPELASGTPQTIQMEMLLNQNGMYMTMPSTGWVKMNLPGVNMQDLIQKSGTQTPDAIIKQIEDMGMTVSLANDQEKNGQKYWVIDVSAGNNILQSDYFKQLYSSMGITQSTEMQKLFDGMSFDFSYAMWINQNTYYTDYMDLDGTMKMNMDVPDASNPGHVDMDMAIKCFYTMSDFGVPFTVPDVSKAVDYPAAGGSGGM